MLAPAPTAPPPKHPIVPAASPSVPAMRVVATSDLLFLKKSKDASSIKYRLSDTL
jgi:hypothetical protein